MSWDVDEKEFYEGFAEIAEDRGIEEAKRWAWSALHWAQQENRESEKKIEELLKHRESCADNLLKGYETGKTEERAAVAAWLRAGTAECREVLSERERADSLSLAYREQQGENDELRAELKATQREREHWHDAWVTAVEHRWGRGASVCAVAYNMAETIERDEHRRIMEDK